MASEAERKAGFAIANVKIVEIARKFVPSMFEGQAEQAIKNNPGLVQDVVDAVLAAAEWARR